MSTSNTSLVVELPEAPNGETSENILVTVNS